MALVKCKECGKDVSNKAKACPHCGAEVPKSQVGCGTIIILGTLAIIAYIIFEMDNTPTGTSSSPATSRSSQDQPERPDEPPTPVLILESMTCTRSDGGSYAQITGRVRNNTSSNLQGVSVVGSFYTADNQDLGSERTFLDIQPLLPGQTSGFTIWGPRNPEYRRCRIDGLMVRNRQVHWERAD